MGGAPPLGGERPKSIEGRRKMVEVSLTCQVQGEGNEAVITSQELQRLLPLHQSAKVICHRFPVEEVVDADQEIPETKEE